ncbi:5'-nucleotidase C-terminal domain-containing protein [Flavobacterium sp. IMCC34852]|uniref:5'-nucleotidase C-terminal domain-containing protein n=1 Tax=Flavobacterium rivulicola TaxID=2732161 RepID=A0A7Y3RAJ7_9FLAO|nr:5'-nucleotidase [Flavobacterium sp. IMCC34852]NNT72953.1 5'-nucleotidase C-terminal domain-containing protein [Flavobacterium sp. IMCC34852]
MVKLKNYNVVLKHFVLLLTFTSLISCAEKKYHITRIEGKEIAITDKHSEVADIENFIKPYRDNIDKDLSMVLANAPETIDKSGEWQTPMGNFLSDITLAKANPIFEKREQKSIDICLLNHGGIRTIISKGDVTARNAYEIMPFENSAIVVGLKGEQILEIVNYLITEKKPHPMKGITFTIAKDKQPKDILVNGKLLDNDKVYYVVTSDYLVNGGDNMLFFKKSVAKYDLDYKLRNIIIDYFKENKIITAGKDIRISKEL